VREFEDAFAALHRVQHAITCTNGTVAIETVLHALGIGCGDEVIVPPFTFIATATAVLLCHASPVFADIDPETMNLSPVAVEAAITPRTRAIIVVHFGGRPADMDALTAIARRHSLALIEDAAHAHGACWRGIPVGNFGVAATFSFQLFKLMTSGEGGIMLTNSAELSEKLWSYCNQGRRSGGGWYEHPCLGTNSRMTGFQAALLCDQLRQLPEQTRIRAERVGLLRARLARLPGLSMLPVDDRIQQDPNYIVTVRCDAERLGTDRDILVKALQAEGIPVQLPYPYPLYRNGVFSQQQTAPFNCRNWHPGQAYNSLYLPECERICREGMWLGHKLFLGDNQDIEDMLAAFEKVHRLIPSLAGSQAGS
jgi:dTDP-4-amino-4,6-dideoxygalactose transaminase